MGYSEVLTREMINKMNTSDDITKNLYINDASTTWNMQEYPTIGEVKQLIQKCTVNTSTNTYPTICTKGYKIKNNSKTENFLISINDIEWKTPMHIIKLHYQSTEDSDLALTYFDYCTIPLDDSRTFGDNAEDFWEQDAEIAACLGDIKWRWYSGDSDKYMIDVTDNDLILTPRNLENYPEKNINDYYCYNPLYYKGIMYKDVSAGIRIKYSPVGNGTVEARLKLYEHIYGSEPVYYVEYKRIGEFKNIKDTQNNINIDFLDITNPENDSLMEKLNTENGKPTQSINSKEEYLSILLKCYDQYLHNGNSMTLIYTYNGQYALHIKYYKRYDYALNVSNSNKPISTRRLEVYTNTALLYFKDDKKDPSCYVTPYLNAKSLNGYYSNSGLCIESITTDHKINMKSYELNWAVDLKKLFLCSTEHEQPRLVGLWLEKLLFH